VAEADLISKTAGQVCDQEKVLSEAEINRMPVDELLQNPVWASVYRRGWEERAMDIQNLSRQPDGELLLHQTPDPPVEVIMASGEPCTPVQIKKAKTEAQQARIRKNWQKLKDKKKARKQLEKQQHMLAISNPEAAKPPSEHFSSTLPALPPLIPFPILQL